LNGEAAIERILGYAFQQKRLLHQALTHRSLAKTEASGASYNNQRLEFLGDGVLGMVIAEMLYHHFPEAAEGELSRRLVALVNGETLTEIARELQLGDYLHLSESEIAHDGRNNASNLEDALEALIAAIYMDGGMEAARQFIHRFWQARLETLTTAPKDPKTGLQEWAQAKGLHLPEYRVVSEEGLAHAPIFTIEVCVQGYPPVSAQAKNKKLAEREAASNMLRHLNEQAS